MARVCQITRVAGQNWNPDDMKRVKLAEKKETNLSHICHPVEGSGPL